MMDTFTLQVGVWIDAGSRNETSANNGVAHLLERLAFKVIIFATSICEINTLPRTFCV